MVPTTFPRPTGRRFRSVGIPLLALAGLATPGCNEMFVDPAPSLTALSVSYSLMQGDGQIASDAFGQADNVFARVQLTGQGTVERTVQFAPGQSEVRVSIELELSGDEAPALVTVQLRRGSDNLYSGTQSLVVRQGEQHEVQMALTPIASAIQLPGSVEVTTLSEPVQLSGTVSFATGDPIPGAAISWTTAAASSNVTLTTGGLFTAHRNGTFPVTAASGSLSASVSVVVAAQAAVTSVAPGEVPAGSRAVLQIQGVNLNHANEVTVCGSAEVENGGLTVAADGRSVQVPVTWFLFEPGTAAPQSGSRCVNVHTPQGTASGSTTLTAPPVGPPATITFLAGMEQGAMPGKPVPTAPLVEVKDASGTPVPGVQVTFSPDLGGTVQNPTTLTGADGRASAGTWTLGDRPFNAPHHNILTAQVPGVNPAGIFAVVENPCLQDWPTLQFGSSASGTLVPGRSCMLSNGRMQDRFVVSVPSSPAIRWALSSDDFPPAVFTSMAGGAPQVDGRSLGAPGTRINELVLPAGSYLVSASTPPQDPLDPTFFGAYTLLSEAVGEPQVGCLPFFTGVFNGSVAQGTLTASDCDENVNEGSRWDGYSILVQSGQTVTVTVTSSVPFGTSWMLGGEIQDVQPGGEPNSVLIWEITAPSGAFYSFFVINEVPNQFGPYTMTFSLAGGSGSPAAAANQGESPFLALPDSVPSSGGGRPR